MYYIYLIYSPSSDKYYVGSTDDPLRRIDQHNNSPFNTFTSKYRPWEWAALFECSESRGEAVRIEKFIKRQKSKRIYQQLIQGKDLHGPLAQLVIPQLRDAPAHQSYHREKSGFFIQI